LEKFLEKINYSKFIAIDIETTGLIPSQDKIIEIAAIKFINGEIKDTFTQLINPGRNLEPYIIELTGINDSMLLTEPTFEKVEKDFLNFIEDIPLVGHNIIFDLNFLSNYSYKFKNQLDINTSCDTYFLSKIFCYNRGSFSLLSMCKYYNIDVTSSHRANVDALNCGKLFLKLIQDIKKIDISNIQEIINFSKLYSLPNNYVLKNIVDCLISTHENNNYLNNINMLNDNIFEYNSKNDNHLNDLSSIFKEGNILSKGFTDYEYRESQEQLSIDILSAFNNSNYLIADAGAGIGKTFAYLIAAIMYINKTDSKCIISTNTHSLQQQIFSSDIPNITKIMDVSCNATLLKGSNNYICLNRLNELIENKNITFIQSEYLELMSLLIWSKETLSGDISECNSFSKDRFTRLWNLINYSPYYCSRSKCKENDLCFYNKVRKSMKKSEIIIVNHALLINNFEKEDFIIDEKHICIIDEAHNFNKVCKEQLTESLSINSFKILKDKIIILNTNLDLIPKNIKYKNILSIYEKIENVFYYLSEEIYDSIDFSHLNKYGNSYTYTFDNPKETLTNLSQVRILIDSINILKSEIINLQESQKSRVLDDLLNEIKKISSKIDYIFFNVNKKILWFTCNNSDGKVNMRLFAAPFIIDNMINNIYDKFDGIIFTSATIAIDDSFKFFYTQMSLSNQVYNNRAIAKIYHSPYFYSDQSKLFIINSDKDINDSQYINNICLMIIDIRKKIKDKRMLILCTSFKQINDFKKIVEKEVESIEHFYFQTKGLSRDLLLKSYLDNNSSVLFGTNTFWEGIDLPKDKLEILLIFKLPFSNPANPFIKANIKYYESNNLNSFSEYQLPEAVIKLKQGFGRLIRSDSDMGVCIITDPRINRKMYGQKIIDVFPVTPSNFSNPDSIINEINNFFGNK